MLHKLYCLLGSHEWTSKAEQGIQPQGCEVPKKEDTYEILKIKFYKYAKVYCRKCGKEMQCY